MTLYQIGDYGANILGQPGNHLLKERIKDSFKRVMATRIRQSIERHGIDDMFKISFEADVIPVDNAFYGVRPTNIKGTELYRTREKLPYPVRFQNDAPFTYIGANGKSAIYVREVELRQWQRRPLPSSSIGEVIAYLWKNQYIIVHLDRRTPKGFTNRVISKIQIESIFPDPEEIISQYDLANDGQNIVVPFADDMVETILYEILKTEYHYVPKETVVTINPSQQK